MIGPLPPVLADRNPPALLLARVVGTTVIVQLQHDSRFDRASVSRWIHSWLDRYQDKLAKRGSDLDEPASYFFLEIGFAQNQAEAEPGVVVAGGEKSMDLGPAVMRAGYGIDADDESGIVLRKLVARTLADL